MNKNKSKSIVINLISVTVLLTFVTLNLFAQNDGKTFKTSKLSQITEQKNNEFNDTGIDETFSPTFESVSSAGFLKDEKNRIYIFSKEIKLGKLQISRVARVNIDGNLDLTFNFKDGQGIWLFYPDGKILGYRNNNKNNKLTLCRFNEDGSIDNTFKSEVEIDLLDSPYIRQDGKIFLIKQDSLILIDADGSIDKSFDWKFSERGKIEKILFTDDFKTIITGKFEWRIFSQIIAKDFAILDWNFNLLTEKQFSFNGPILQVQKTSNGKYLLTGDFSYIKNLANERESWQRRGIVRLNSDYSIDENFNPILPYTSPLLNMQIQHQNNGDIYVSGKILETPPWESYKLLKINVDGTIDSNYLVAVRSGFSYRIQYNSDNSAVLCGDLVGERNGEREKVIKLLPNGSQDLSFRKIELSGSVYNAISQNDGKIFVSGIFDKVNNQTALGGVRLNQDGSVDTSIQLNNHYNSGLENVSAAELQPDDKILVAGNFSHINGVYVKEKYSTFFPGIARLNSDGTLDESFSAELKFDDLDSPSYYENLNKISKIKVQNDGKILVANKNQLIRLNPDGSYDNQFQNILFGYWNGEVVIEDILFDSSGKIVVYGQFNPVLIGNEQLDATNIARFNMDGTFDSKLIPSHLIFRKINKIVFSSDEKMYVARDANYFESGFLPRLNNDGTIDTTYFWSNYKDGVQGNVYDLMIEDNNNLLVSGQLYSYDNSFKSLKGIFRLDSLGRAITIFENKDIKESKLLRQTNDLYIAFGQKINRFDQFKLIRYFSNGQVDKTFEHILLINDDILGFQNFQGILIQNDQKILVFGNLKSVDGIPKIGIVRLNANSH